MSGFTLKDLVRESLEGVGARPSRLFITLAGTVLGIASLVMTIGMAQTASGQISSQFDAVAATRVTVEPGQTSGSEEGQGKPTARIPWDADERVRDLAGVVDASLVGDLPEGVTVEAVQVHDPTETPKAPPRVVAGTADLVDVVQGTIATGRWFDAGSDARADRVVVLGANAAEKLGINRVSGQPAIFIDDRAYTVVGILGDVGARKTLLDTVIIPIATAREQLDLKAPSSLDIRIDVGAGPVVAKQAPIAVDPNNPDGYKVGAPSTGGALREGIQSDINVLFVVIGVVALLGGGIGIANVTLLSVSERRGEIGLRRALGARTREIARQFMLESVTTGLLGGLIGAAVGLFGLLAVCVVQQWTPVLAPWAAPAGVLLGAVVGWAAGAYPAMKAARVEPVDALRDGG